MTERERKFYRRLKKVEIEKEIMKERERDEIKRDTLGKRINEREHERERLIDK